MMKNTRKKIQRKYEIPVAFKWLLLYLYTKKKHMENKKKTYIRYDSLVVSFRISALKLVPIDRIAFYGVSG